LLPANGGTITFFIKALNVVPQYGILECWKIGKLGVEGKDLILSDLNPSNPLFHHSIIPLFHYLLYLRLDIEKGKNERFY